MGNSVGGAKSVGLLSNVGEDGSSYRLHQLEKYACIDVKQREIKKYNYGHDEKWTVTYLVESTRFEVELTKQYDKSGDCRVLYIDGRGTSSYQNMSFGLGIRKTDTGLLERFEWDRSDGPNWWLNNNKTFHAKGGVTVTKVYLCGRWTRGSLLVLEGKKKSRDENPFHSFTVAHYLVNSSHDVFHRDKTDIGYSLVVKIRPSNRDLDVTVEGPLQHPSSALFYMFDEVYKSGVWKPTSCPHCANVKWPRSGNVSQSDSDDSDNLSQASSLPRGSNKQLAGGSVLANDGAINGNNNGNLHVNKLFLTKK